jgi:hypothetical protein
VNELEFCGAGQPQVREDCRSQAGKSVGEDKGGRSQGDASIRQGTPKMTSTPPPSQTEREAWGSLEGISPALILSWDLQPPALPKSRLLLF